MDSILSNVIIVEEIDFQEYNYHPELTLYFIRHLYSGDAEFLMRILSEYFPEKVILANFLNEEYHFRCTDFVAVVEHSNFKPFHFLSES